MRKDSLMINSPDIKQGGVRSNGQGVGVPGRSQDQFLQSPTPRRPLLRNLVVVMLLVGLVFGAVMTASLAYSAGDQLRIRIGNQQSALVDLRQSLPISPYLLGANVFPESGTNSVDEANDGFMSYGTQIQNGLRSAHIKLLRFPGGEWGENHTYSLDQLNAFSNLLAQTGAEGMIQAQLSDPNGQASTLATRASRAGLIVDYMNNKKSIQRTGTYAHAPFHPVALWTVGNEPDRLVNPDTGKLYTVNDYVQAFIQFSTVMHQNDPTIKVFGPEISQFYGLGSGPTDATGKFWMEDFLKGISEYERQHPTLGFHLLDGVSFHRYQFSDARQASALLLSSTSEWDYTLPPLRQLIRQDFGRDLPIAITEVNTNPGSTVPSRQFATGWWADTLGRLMNSQVEYAAFFSAEGVNTPYPLFTMNSPRSIGGLQETPMLRVMQLFTHLQSNVVPVQVQREPVSVYVTQDDTHSTVSLLFINKSGSSQLAQVSSESGFLPIHPWPELQIQLSAYGIAVVTLHRDGGAEAYSYVTPRSGQMTPALAHLVCGNAGNILDDSTHC